MKIIFAFTFALFSCISIFASPLSLSGNWIDAENNKTSILQNKDKIILSRESVKMNGTVNDKKVSIIINNTILTGTISDDNLVITWSNGNEWYREISGSWKNKENSKSVEQIGNIIRVKNSKGEVEYLGFLKGNGFTLIHKTNNNSINGVLSKSNELTWSDGSIWIK
jgi:hypothetical protein